MNSKSQYIVVFSNNLQFRPYLWRWYIEWVYIIKVSCFNWFLASKKYNIHMPKENSEDECKTVYDAPRGPFQILKQQYREEEEHSRSEEL